MLPWPLCLTAPQKKSPRRSPGLCDASGPIPNAYALDAKAYLLDTKAYVLKTKAYALADNLMSGSS